MSPVWRLPSARAGRADAMARGSGIGAAEPTIRQKLLHLSWELVLLISLTACIGLAMLYSAAHGSFDPWASRQMMRSAFGVVMMIAIALVYSRSRHNCV